MSWTCPHWVDMYTAWVSGICLGLLVGIVGTRLWMAVVDWRRINEHSQRGPH